MRKRVIKLIVAVLCLMAFCMPLVAYAEDVPPVDVTTTAPDETTPPEDVVEPSEDGAVPPVDDTPTTDESASDGKFSWEEVKETVSSTIMIWVQENSEEIGVVVALIGYGITLIKKFKSINKSMGTMNNNAITIAKETTNYMDGALKTITDMAQVVESYKVKMDVLLKAYENSEQARNKLEVELVEIKEYLKVDSMASTEFANELAELLALANIPNYKKEELGARHQKNVLAIKEAEEHAAHVSDSLLEVEVKEDVDTE